MNKIFSTKDYKKFKKLEGNRNVLNKRVSLIKKSIENIGYIINPIIVNENFEIIDGQGRFECLKELGMPIDYIIQVGAGIKECIAMNINNTNWKLQDFIDSYAERGYVDYKRIKAIQERYDYGLGVIATATKLLGKFDNNKIKNGTIEITEQDYINAIERLEWLNGIAPFCKKCSGELTYLYQSLIMCREFKDIDLEKLKDRVISQNSIMNPFANIPDCMKSLEELYNRNRKNKVYIFTEYRKWVSENIVGYKERLESGSYRKESLR